MSQFKLKNSHKSWIRSCICRGGGPPELPQDAIQALDVALKHGTLLNPMCTGINHSFYFYDPKTTHTLGNGAEVGTLNPLLNPLNKLLLLSNVHRMGLCGRTWKEMAREEYSFWDFVDELQVIRSSMSFSSFYAVDWCSCFNRA